MMPRRLATPGIIQVSRNWDDVIGPDAEALGDAQRPLLFVDPVYTRCHLTTITFSAGTVARRQGWPASTSPGPARGHGHKRKE